MNIIVPFSTTSPFFPRTLKGGSSPASRDRGNEEGAIAASKVSLSEREGMALSVRLDTESRNEDLVADGVSGESNELVEEARVSDGVLRSAAEVARDMFAPNPH